MVTVRLIFVVLVVWSSRCHQIIAQFSFALFGQMLVQRRTSVSATRPRRKREEETYIDILSVINLQFIIYHFAVPSALNFPSFSRFFVKKWTLMQSNNILCIAINGNKKKRDAWKRIIESTNNNFHFAGAICEILEKARRSLFPTKLEESSFEKYF